MAEKEVKTGRPYVQVDAALDGKPVKMRYYLDDCDGARNLLRDIGGGMVSSEKVDADDVKRAIDTLRKAHTANAKPPGDERMDARGYQDYDPVLGGGALKVKGRMERDKSIIFSAAQEYKEKGPREMAARVVGREVPFRGEAEKLKLAVSGYAKAVDAASKER